MSEKVIKWAGIIGSILIGGSLVVKGQTEAGIGIITAAFGSGSALIK